MKRSTGFTTRQPDGRYLARITFTDPVTKRRVSVKKIHDTAADASDWLAQQRRKIGAQVAGGDVKTFRELAAYYLIHHATAPEWRAGRLISGMRSFRDVQQRARIIVEYLGEKRLHSLTYDDLVRLRKHLLTRRVTKVGKEGERVETERTFSVATTNRILSIARAMLNVAKQQGWLNENPFTRGKGLIRVKDEVERERILTPEEETRLLAACGAQVRRGSAESDTRHAHLRPILIVALDTGMRFGEMKRLRWKDVDFESGIITLIASHTKTLKRRYVGMTERVHAELWKLWEKSSMVGDEPVFGVKFNVDKSWRAVREKAGLHEDEYDSDGTLIRSKVRFHDLRHTAATRLIGAGVAAPLTGRLLGHTEASTTYRYVNSDIQMAQQAASILSRQRRRLLAAASKRKGKQKGQTVN